MAISFSKDDGPLAGTVEETDSLVSDDEDEATTVGSETSMTKYDLVSNALPPYCFFGIEECRALFVQSSDKAKFDRVCGGKLAMQPSWAWYCGEGEARALRARESLEVLRREGPHLPDAGGI
jgi:hypothetical protein